jgi:DNA replication and repair protein RecF
MHIQSVHLLQFKNHPNARFGFESRVTGISGVNGSGKTNLLDALHYLSFSRSYFSRSDQSCVSNGLEGFRLDGYFQRLGTEGRIQMIFRPNGKKEIMVDEEMFSRVSDYIGMFPSVVIAPDDIELIIGTSEERRRFMDGLIAQFNPFYLQQLVLYNKLLQQRNSHLKGIALAKSPDYQLLEVFNHQIAPVADAIYEIRHHFFQHFTNRVQQLYLLIAGKAESVAVQYQSPLTEKNMASILNDNLQRDVYLQRTSVGVHKDDLILSLETQPFKQVASQGQRKSMLFAMKLAAAEVLLEEKGFPPLLLLDDVFEKLDQNRMHNLLHKVCCEMKSQVFITDTHSDRLQSAFQNLALDFDLLHLS